MPFPDRAFLGRPGLHLTSYFWSVLRRGGEPTYLHVSASGSKTWEQIGSRQMLCLPLGRPPSDPELVFAGLCFACSYKDHFPLICFLKKKQQKYIRS